MPVLVNRESGLAENLPDTLASQAVSSTHDVPLNDPEGNPVTVPYQEAASLIQQGYSQPSPEQLQSLLDYSKYSSPMEQVKTGLEGAASAATFGASTAAEVGLGIAKKEDIQKREEVNPGVHALGEVAGLGASMLTGVGEGAVLERAGKAVAEKVAPMLSANFAGRVGTQAAKAGIENMLFQSGDEASKLFASDPHQSMETAISDIGLAGALGIGIGGGLGTVSELWKLGPGSKVEGLLKAVQERSGGLPEELKAAAGVHVPQELEAVLGDSPIAQKYAQILQESNSSSGSKLREAIETFKQDTNNEILSTLGKQGSDLDALSSYSSADSGTTLKDSLANKVEEIVQPISEKYDKFERTFKNAPLTADTKAEIANQVANAAAEAGYHKMPNSPANKFINRVLEELPLQETASDLKKYITNLRNEAPWGHEAYQAGKQVRAVLGDALDKTLAEHVQINAPGAIAEYAATKEAYKGARELIDTLNERLHVGKFGGPDSFVKELRSMAPEDVLRRLNIKGDSELATTLQKHFPEVIDTIRDAELNRILKASLTNGELNSSKLFKQLEKLEPEARSFLMNEQQLMRLEALNDLSTRLKTNLSRMNPSGTARTMDKLFEEMPASALGIGAMAAGHSGVAGYIIGKLATLIGREAPDALRLATLKFLAAGEPLSAPGFKSMVEVASAVAKGETKLNKAIDSVVRGGREVISEPSKKETELLQKQIKQVAMEPNVLFNVGGNIGHYLPEHNSALAQISARNLQYLSSCQPNTAPLGILDGPRTPSKSEQSAYTRALQLAQQPLLILNAVKDGSVTPQDTDHIRAMYPALYQRMNEKLINQLIEAKSEGHELPYKTRIGLSIFTGQNLDSSMQPASILSSQMLRQPQQQPPTGQAKMQKLDKMPDMYKSSVQKAADK